MHCTQTHDSFAKTFGKDVGRGQVGKPLKFGDYRSRNWGTVPPNMPQNGQIRAFSCTVDKCVIDLRLFFGTQMSVHYAHIVLEQEPDRRKDGATVPPKLGKFLPLDAYVEISRERCEIRGWCQ